MSVHNNDHSVLRLGHMEHMGNISFLLQNRVHKCITFWNALLKLKVTDRKLKDTTKKGLDFHA